MSSNFNTKLLCRIAKVSLSWYYKHKKNVVLKQTKEDNERCDLEKINELVVKYKRKYWYRQITMKLNQQWIFFNHKKVLRIMNKYNLISTIRKKDPLIRTPKSGLQ